MSKEQKSVVVFSCDVPGCKRRAAAGSVELLSEWRKAGVYIPGKPDSHHQWDFCGEHAHEADRIGRLYPAAEKPEVKPCL